ncbi:MAG: CDP-alcohol phosphatidyltransferase family protein [Candidatus Kerfeldbacteria bacterium]
MHEIKKIADVKPFQKPQDSVFSMLFTRRLSRILTFILVKADKGVTPNKVSTFSFLLAVIACVLFVYEDYWARFAGVILLQLSFAFDCSDGEIARIKNMSSKFGAWLDSVYDRIKEVLMFASMTLYWFLYEERAVWVLLVGFFAIIGLLLVSYLREAKRSSWPSNRVSELFIAKDIYVGTVDVTIYLVSFAVLFNFQVYILTVFLLVSIPLLAKQFLSAYRLSKKEI